MQGYQFTFDLNLTNVGETEDYGLIIGGIPGLFSITTTNLMLPPTDVNGQVSFQITLLTVPLDTGDSISVQIKTNDNSTNIGSAFSYTK